MLTLLCALILCAGQKTGPEAVALDLSVSSGPTEAQAVVAGGGVTPVVINCGERHVVVKVTAESITATCAERNVPVRAHAVPEEIAVTFGAAVPEGPVRDVRRGGTFTGRVRLLRQK
jgi:hypothetical protein